MACVQPDGSLTAVARKVLRAIEGGAALAEAAREAGVPVYRVRASLRELTEAGLVRADGERWEVTDEGRAALE